MTLRYGVIGGILMATALVATSFAGKPERDKANELKPKVTAAGAAVKAACGCAATVSVKWDSYGKADDMMRIGDACDDIETAVKAQCQTPEDKKAYCKNVTGYEISYNKEGGTATLKGKTIQLTTSDAGHPGDHLITEILKKF